ncbi:hypothetical protein BESB_053480 [Besnoitia besnoiti]|uniref:BTB domain-containing protein n=1 Tax=Besnoitia besnoiti TaxID=94643 RepID=A0A2A9MJC2_BESBE|nr:hypothetical protein BESB_053480 [Besnoitia besnoiti]PFH35697.1 hypothetical protein BESB_053480 [Besnoitia besnoiti]
MMARRLLHASNGRQPASRAHSGASGGPRSGRGRNPQHSGASASSLSLSSSSSSASFSAASSPLFRFPPQLSRSLSRNVSATNLRPPRRGLPGANAPAPPPSSSASSVPSVSSSSSADSADAQGHLPAAFSAVNAEAGGIGSAAPSAGGHAAESGFAASTAESASLRGVHPSGKHEKVNPRALPFTPAYRQFDLSSFVDKRRVCANWRVTHFPEIWALAKNRFLRAPDEDQYLDSPLFGDAEVGFWFLRLYPYGDSKNAGSLELYLMIDSCLSEDVVVHYKLQIFKQHPSASFPLSQTHNNRDFLIQYEDSDLYSKNEPGVGYGPTHLCDVSTRRKARALAWADGSLRIRVLMDCPILDALAGFRARSDSGAASRPIVALKHLSSKRDEDGGAAVREKTHPLQRRAPPSLSDELTAFLDEQETDLELLFNGEVFDASKLILASRSKVFRAMLRGPFQEGKGESSVASPVPVRGFQNRSCAASELDQFQGKTRINLSETAGLTAGSLRNLLIYMHTDTCPLLASEEERKDAEAGAPLLNEVERVNALLELLIAADLYDVQSVYERCIDEVISRLSRQNFAAILFCASRINCRRLAKATRLFANSLSGGAVAGKMLQLLESCWTVAARPGGSASVSLSASSPAQDAPAPASERETGVKTRELDDSPRSDADVVTLVPGGSILLTSGQIGGGRETPRLNAATQLCRRRTFASAGSEHTSRGRGGAGEDAEALDKFPLSPLSASRTGLGADAKATGNKRTRCAVATEAGAHAEGDGGRAENARRGGAAPAAQRFSSGELEGAERGEERARVSSKACGLSQALSSCASLSAAHCLAEGTFDFTTKPAGSGQRACSWAAHGPRVFPRLELQDADLEGRLCTCLSSPRRVCQLAACCRRSACASLEEASSPAAKSHACAFPRAAQSGSASCRIACAACTSSFPACFTASRSASFAEFSSRTPCARCSSVSALSEPCSLRASATAENKEESLPLCVGIEHSSQRRGAPPATPQPPGEHEARDGLVRGTANANEVGSEGERERPFPARSFRPPSLFGSRPRKKQRVAADADPLAAETERQLRRKSGESEEEEDLSEFCPRRPWEVLRRAVGSSADGGEEGMCTTRQAAPRRTEVECSSLAAESTFFALQASLRLSQASSAPGDPQAPSTRFHTPFAASLRSPCPPPPPPPPPPSSPASPLRSLQFGSSRASSSPRFPSQAALLPSPGVSSPSPSPTAPPSPATLAPRGFRGREASGLRSTSESRREKRPSSAGCSAGRLSIDASLSALPAGADRAPGGSPSLAGAPASSEASCLVSALPRDASSLSSSALIRCDPFQGRNAAARTKSQEDGGRPSPASARRASRASWRLSTSSKGCETLNNPLLTDAHDKGQPPRLFPASSSSPSSPTHRGHPLFSSAAPFTGSSSASLQARFAGSSAAESSARSSGQSLEEDARRSVGAAELATATSPRRPEVGSPAIGRCEEARNAASAESEEANAGATEEKQNEGRRGDREEEAAELAAVAESLPPQAETETRCPSFSSPSSSPSPFSSPSSSSASSSCPSRAAAVPPSIDSAAASVAVWPLPGRGAASLCRRGGESLSKLFSASLGESSVSADDEGRLACLKADTGGI